MNRQILFYLAAFLTLAISFQNCAEGFGDGDDPLQNAAGTTPTPNPGGPTPTPTPNPGGPTPTPTPQGTPGATPTPAPSVFSKVSAFSNPGQDRVYGLAQGNDLSVYYAGETTANPADPLTRDATLVKLSPTGTVVWATAIAGARNDQFFDVIVTNDGNVLAAGLTNSFSTVDGSDAILVKVNSQTGAVIWARSIRGPRNEIFFGIKELPDGSLIAVGETSSSGGGLEDGLIVKMTALGAVQWSTSVGGAATDRFVDVAFALEGGSMRYIAVGDSGSFSNPPLNGFIAKFSDTGTVMWTRTMGGSTNDNITSVIPMPSGAYAFAGKSGYATIGGSDGYIAVITSDGLLVNSLVAGTGNYDTIANITLAPDGDFIAAGMHGNTRGFADITASGVHIMKIASDLTRLRWAYAIGKENTRNDTFFHAFMKRKDGGYAIGSNSLAYSANNDPLIVQTDQYGRVNEAACTEANRDIAAGSVLRPPTNVLVDNAVTSGPLFTQPMLTPVVRNLTLGALLVCQ